MIYERFLPTIAKPLAQVLARFNRTRASAARRRELAQQAIGQARRQAEKISEAERGPERLALAIHIFRWAATFIQSEEGRWAFRRWRLWRIAWDLDLDETGRLWRAASVNWFGRVRSQPVASPEHLVRLYPEAKLRDLVATTQQNFWTQALSRELSSLILPRGRTL